MRPLKAFIDYDDDSFIYSWRILSNWTSMILGPPLLHFTLTWSTVRKLFLKEWVVFFSPSLEVPMPFARLKWLMKSGIKAFLSYLKTRVYWKPLAELVSRCGLSLIRVGLRSPKDHPGSSHLVSVSYANYCSFLVCEDSLLGLDCLALGPKAVNDWWSCCRQAHCKFL